MADCEEAWGFFPCSSNVGGNLILMFGYGYVLLQGATWIGDGCEELLGFIGPGILGGLVLPVLGALPDAMMVLMSGMFTTSEKAQSQVAVGMGTLVGSTVMLLSIALGGSTWLGRCDLDDDGVAIDRRLTDNSFSFSKLFFDKKTGITTEQDTPFNCKIMLLSSIAFLVVEIPALAGYTKDPTPSLVGTILCFVLLVTYCAYQVILPDLQEKKVKILTMCALTKELQFKQLQSLNQGLTEEALETIFSEIDTDNSNTVTEQELVSAMVTLSVGKGIVPNKSDIQAWMADMDENGDGTLDLKEFKTGMKKWYSHYKTMGEEDKKQLKKMESSEYASITIEEEDSEEESDDLAVPVSQEVRARNGLLQVLLGVLTVSIFSEPMVDAVDGFSDSMGLPTFYVSFILTPFASNASELVSSLKFAAKKKKKNISLTYSQIWGAITMNNTMVLGLFLLIVYTKNLEWQYTAETASVLLPIWLSAYWGYGNVNIPTSAAGYFLALYPLSLAFCVILESFGIN